MADGPSPPPATGRCICIHGHFYQPPRENPWLEAVETQDSAAPYHDWNDRVTAECYAPNGASRIVNRNDQIVRIVNNYSRISFNFGPTLLSWLEKNAPRTYRMILAGDQMSAARYDGHGSALAQPYNHVIMPLANTRDRITQIRWGIADFEHRFGRKPEGMWLPETAVDLETLDLLAQHGIRFTILAPHQCVRVRELDETSLQPTLPEMRDAAAGWMETPDASVDPRRPYLVRLDEGRSIAVFFYDGPISRAVAFEGILNSGENFAERLTGAFDAESSETQLVHIATDGESYGHHHRHGEMALSYALRLIEDGQEATLTNYGAFLAAFPPTWEAEVAEDTSWSCVHGVERWRSNCGCNGGRQGWNQQWRAPLRKALDWLRDSIAPLTEKVAESLLKDVWEARNAYIAVILAGAQERTWTEEAIDRFFAAHAAHDLSPSERVRVLKLMEMQRHAQLMYTSCGWFFDDISGIETVQVIAYAARAIQLAGELFGIERGQLEKHFLETLVQAKSNVPQWKDGAEVYKRLVKPLEVGLEQVAAHYAIASFFDNYPEETTLFCYSVRRLDYEIVPSGRGRLAVGRVRIESNITEKSETFFFAALHFGDQNVTAAVKLYAADSLPAFATFKKKCISAVKLGNLPEVVRLIDGYFGGSPYSLVSLFRDDQRRILRMILQSTLGGVERSLAVIYEEHASLLHFLSTAGLPKPPILAMAAGFSVNAGLHRALESDPVDLARVHSLIVLAKDDGLSLDQHDLGYLIDQSMKRAMVSLQSDPLNEELLDRTVDLARALREFAFRLNLWQAQNIWHDTLVASPQFLNELESASAERWREGFLELGRQLGIAVEQLVVEDAPSAAREGAPTPSEVSTP
jgi:alpha-amylase/alpha-mannosidase (GH57 family)